MSESLRDLSTCPQNGGAVNPCVSDEPAIRTRRELRLRMVAIPRMALNLHHDIRIGAHDQVRVNWDEEPFRDFVPHLPDEILRPVIREEFAANPINAEDSALPVVMNHALPEAGADVERVVQVLRRDEHVRRLADSRRMAEGN